MPILPSLFASLLAPFLRTDASEEWGESTPEDADGCANEALCRLEREQPALAQGPIDLTTAAAKAKYTSGSLKGKLKRSAYPPVPLAKRRVVIALTITAAPQARVSPVPGQHFAASMNMPVRFSGGQTIMVGSSGDR